MASSDERSPFIFHAQQRRGKNAEMGTLCEHAALKSTRDWAKICRNAPPRVPDGRQNPLRD
jgi:hypothetical protein